MCRNMYTCLRYMCYMSIYILVGFSYGSYGTCGKLLILVRFFRAQLGHNYT